MKNTKTIAIIIIVIVVITAILGWNQSKSKDALNENISSSAHQDDSPRILSTKPDPLEEAIVGANETIEITFNRSLENVGEFKLRIEPKIEYKLELSQDRKTAKIIPLKPYELGSTYTLFIGTDTKFDGVGAWGQEKIYHFKTIKYRGV